MKSLLNAKSAYIDRLPKGTLFALKRYGVDTMFGIKLSAPEDQPNNKPKILLLNPQFGHERDAHRHLVTIWEADERCISLGEDWVIDPIFTAEAISDLNEPQANAALTIGPAGMHFRCASGEGARLMYRHHIHVDTLEPANNLDNSAFHLTGYRLYLSKEDVALGREPVFKL